jgi:glyoxylase-like metal-dependent hydrolase (beta-lactamase superfamily II)
LDGSSYSKGGVMRPVEPSPGLITQLIVKNLNKRPSPSADHIAGIDKLISMDGEITGTGGLQAIHSPGHTAGHIAYFWPKHNGVLFVGDAASNMLHLGYSILYESFSQGQETLVKLGQMQFNTACFSHGKAIQSGASDRFKNTFHQ